MHHFFGLISIMLTSMLMSTKTANASTNGCGPQMNMTLIDSSSLFQTILNGIGLGDFTACCNTHDTCYSKPNCYKEKREKCDDQFNECLNSVCSKYYLLTRIKCKLTSSIMFSAVKKLGQKFFCVQIK